MPEGIPKENFHFLPMRFIMENVSQKSFVSLQVYDMRP